MHSKTEGGRSYYNFKLFIYLLWEVASILPSSLGFTCIPANLLKPSQRKTGGTYVYLPSAF